MDLVKGCLPLCSGIMQNSVVLQHMSFVFHPKGKLDELESVMRDLMAKKEDIQRELDHPRNKGKRPNSQLRRWLHKAGETEDKVQQLLDEYSKGNCDAFSWLKNCYSRYKIGSEAFKLKDEIDVLLKDKQSEISLVETQPPLPVPASHRILGKGIASKLDTICSYLTDETVGMVGVWGMGGVGKTTLLRKIQSLLDNANMAFDHVLFIVASQNIQLEKLREEIAKKLQLPSSAGTEDIFNVLKINNFVLLLDDIWEEIDLNDLGIPHPCGDNNSTKQYKYKVVFSTRSEDVCARMGASKMIRVECLEPDEAWDLFKDNVNSDVIESDERINKIAKQVINACSGLPLALKVIGKAMSNKKTLPEWKFVLRSLESSNTKVVQGVEESLFPILKFSYDNLPDNVKNCFLSASMLQGRPKYKLLECWMGLGLVGDFVYLQEAFDKVEYILKTLEESCLLYFSHDGYMCFHDVIYEMAMWIASDCGMNRNKWIAKGYYGFTEIPTNDTKNWRFANRVMTAGDMELLPILSHQCPDLLCLMILESFLLNNIPEGFFPQMPNLMYLDLSRTGIKELPKDIKCLVNLQYLNISDTLISSLPKELVYLNKMQYLLCRDLGGLSKVEDGLMSKLQKLKVIDLYPYGWVEPDELKLLKKHIRAIGMRVVSQEVLQQLSYLPTTQLCIENLDKLISLSFDTLSCKNHGFLHALQIKSCSQLERLVMNGIETHLNDLIICDVKKLLNIIWTDLSPPEFFHMLKRLCIFRCNLTSFSWVLHLPCLFELNIEDCAEIEMLFYPEEREIQPVSECLMFPALQSLFLIKLPKLGSISNFALDFPRLSQLTVRQCLNLKKLPFRHGINNRQITYINCKRKWWESLEWDDGIIPSHLAPDYSTIFWMSKVNGRLIAANEQSLSFLFFCLHKLEIISCSNQVFKFLGFTSPKGSQNCKFSLRIISDL
ncbi:probable disease resistance protein At1g61300 isoform X2 [Dioscorea cayenensis subsp. rotundata]|uniref:Probable disease resistance protein At1g61300 isoform X2 n=1 Tax=Dioscorea cayennensis subsp. rotundata TaxID=55577 RepID=A0AB40AYS7_DIOCR|nr:probable disease resistance protein At1g61300 isoform X2 [Dioscorea cayenensis subsp. rotundata]